ncbi:hypothetical protein [Enterobacter wuhouensis]|uniref:hypothetical protein n=1 Tax=Enterobacter wuhouensis TaxID=2529381 RepID=UPI0035259866
MNYKELSEFRKYYDMKKFVQDMNIDEYSSALEKEAIVQVDSHGYIVDSFTGMSLAADAEQLILLIAHLERLRSVVNKKNTSR